MILGVSADTAEEQHAFCEKYGFTYPLLADTGYQVIEPYGAGRQGQGVKRITVVVGPDGKVKKLFPKVSPRGHAREVLEAL